MELVSLLGSLGRSVKEAREMGRKFWVVEGASRGKGGKGGYAGMGGGGMEDMWSQGLSGESGPGGGLNGESLSMEGGYVM